MVSEARDDGGLLLAVDGDSLTHRAFHAYEASGREADDGRPVFAVHGFVSLLASLTRRLAPDGLVVGFDSQERGWRYDRAPEYKAHRPAKDPRLAAQRDEIVDVVDEIGVARVVRPGWEADDVVASAATAAVRRGWSCVVATSDRDAWQLPGGGVAVLAVGRGSSQDAPLLDDDAVWRRCGVSPRDYVLYAALRGDASDGLAGVDGVGEKTAARLVAGCGGDVERLLADPEAAGASPRIAAAVRAAGARVRRNVEVMTAERGLEVGDPVSWRLPEDPQRVAEVLRRRGVGGVSSAALPLTRAA